MDEPSTSPRPAADADDARREIDRLRAQLDRQREENDYYRDRLLSDIAQQIDVRANRLEEDIKGRFFGSVKVFSWIIGLIFIAATAGGFYNAWRQIPSMVQDEVRIRVETEVQDQTADIEGQLELAMNRKLVDVEREVSGNIQASARAELARFAEELERQRDDAGKIARSVGRLVRPLELLSSAKAGDLERVSALLDEDTEAGIRDGRGRTPLILAASGGFAEVVAALLDRSPNVNDRDWDGKTALIHAAERGYSDVTEVLLARGADANVADESNRTALILAAVNGHARVVEQLTVYSDIERAGVNGTTALLEAVEGRKDAVTESLLMNGANVNARRDDGTTPLIIATYQGNERLASELLDRGADPCLEGPDGKLPSAIARDFGREGIEALIARRAPDCASETRLPQ